MVEFALVVPLLLLLAIGGVGVGRIVQARMAVSAIAREAARAAVLSPMPPAGSQSAARAAAEVRAAAVALDYHVSCQPAGVQFTPAASFGPGSRIQVNVTCSVGANTLPLLHWQGLNVSGGDLEEVDPFRSLHS